MSQSTEDRDEFVTAVEPEEHAYNLARVEAVLPAYVPNAQTNDYQRGNPL
jgi:hypothetical protein